MRGGGNWLPLYAILVALILLITGGELLVAFTRRRLHTWRHRGHEAGVTDGATTDFLQP